MTFKATIAAVLIAGSSTLAMAQGTTNDGATANEKPGQGTNTGVKDDKMMGPQKMAPAEGASSGASAGTSGDQKGMPPTNPDNKNSPKQ